MIPIALTLRNFMSYGEEPVAIDFSGMHVVSLSGDNGNGKSALLDAITYALWGKTRASGSQASGEDDLVRLGAEEMEVTFDFLMGDDRYRAIRKRNRRTHTGDWQAQLCDHAGVWRPVGGSGMRETERHLTRILRMEYETFLNSAYIQQGRADEFTRQKPGDRKRILADILDLSRYDRLEQMAKDYRAECDLALRDLDGEIRHLEARVAEEPALAARLADAQQTLDAAVLSREAAAARLQSARDRLALFEEKARALREHEERLRDYEADTREVAGRLDELRAKAQEDAALLAEREAIRLDYERLVAARRSSEALQPRVAELGRLRQQSAALDAAIELGRQRLRLQAATLEQQRKQAVDRAARALELRARLADLSQGMERFAGADEGLAARQAELTAAQEEFATLAARQKQIKVRRDEIGEMLELLAQPKTACPVCESDLTGGRQQAVADRQRSRLAELAAELAAIQKAGVRVRKQRDDLAEAVAALGAQSRGLAALKAQALEVERALEELHGSDVHVADLDRQLDRLRTRESEGRYAEEERSQLAVVQREAADLEKAVCEYEATQELIRALTEAGAERRFARLEEAARAEERERAEAARLEAQLAKRQAIVERERAKQEAMQAEAADLQAVRSAAAAAEAEARVAEGAYEAALSQVERLRHAVEDCVRVRQQLVGKRAEHERVARDKRAYTELAAAFGRKGVQALIIDNALPEIQDEANRLLARMTDNAMQISLSTLKTGRSTGAQIETLDISITDDAGTRPYEMYSGGEAFRINFAIRIALSRLLARRAGARLQTLIVDEGFGTQDAKGRERLVEAIEVVKEDFSLILVISHIEELKDAFPTRIEISKTLAGSQATLLE